MEGLQRASPAGRTTVQSSLHRSHNAADASSTAADEREARARLLGGGEQQQEGRGNIEAAAPFSLMNYLSAEQTGPSFTPLPAYRQSISSTVTGPSSGSFTNNGAGNGYASAKIAGKDVRLSADKVRTGSREGGGNGGEVGGEGEAAAAGGFQTARQVAGGRAAPPGKAKPPLVMPLGVSIGELPPAAGAKERKAESKVVPAEIAGPAQAGVAPRTQAIAGEAGCGASAAEDQTRSSETRAAQSSSAAAEKRNRRWGSRFVSSRSIGRNTKKTASGETFSFLLGGGYRGGNEEVAAAMSAKVGAKAGAAASGGQRGVAPSANGRTAAARGERPESAARKIFSTAAEEQRDLLMQEKEQRDRRAKRWILSCLVAYVVLGILVLYCISYANLEWCCIFTIFGVAVGGIGLLGMRQNSRRLLLIHAIAAALLLFALFVAWCYNFYVLIKAIEILLASSWPPWNHVQFKYYYSIPVTYTSPHAPWVEEVLRLRLQYPSQDSSGIYSLIGEARPSSSTRSNSSKDAKGKKKAAGKRRRRKREAEDAAPAASGGHAAGRDESIAGRESKEKTGPAKANGKGPQERVLERKQAEAEAREHRGNISEEAHPIQTGANRRRLGGVASIAAASQLHVEKYLFQMGKSSNLNSHEEIAEETEGAARAAGEKRRLFSVITNEGNSIGTFKQHYVYQRNEEEKQLLQGASAEVVANIFTPVSTLQWRLHSTASAAAAAPAREGEGKESGGEASGTVGAAEGLRAVTAGQRGKTLVDAVGGGVNQEGRTAREDREIKGALAGAGEKEREAAAEQRKGKRTVAVIENGEGNTASEQSDFKEIVANFADKTGGRATQQRKIDDAGFGIAEHGGERGTGSRYKGLGVNWEEVWKQERSTGGRRRRLGERYGANAATRAGGVASSPPQKVGKRTDSVTLLSPPPAYSEGSWRATAKAEANQLRKNGEEELKQEKSPSYARGSPTAGSSLPAVASFEANSEKPSTSKLPAAQSSASSSSATATSSPSSEIYGDISGEDGPLSGQLLRGSQLPQQQEAEPLPKVDLYAVSLRSPSSSVHEYDSSSSFSSTFSSATTAARAAAEGEDALEIRKAIDRNAAERALIHGCVVGAAKNSNFVDDAAHAMSALATRGWLCAFARAGVLPFHRWPVNCKTECGYGFLHVGHDLQAANYYDMTRVAEFLIQLSSLKPKQTQQCVDYAAATICSIRNRNFFLVWVVVLLLWLLLACVACCGAMPFSLYSTVQVLKNMQQQQQKPCMTE